jgi:ketosteroid isomerase-like protein
MADQRDMEVLNAAYAEWAQGEFKRADMFTADAEFVVSGPDPRTYVGPEGVGRGWFDFLSAWDDFRTEAVEILEGSEKGTYVVLVHLRARGKESSVPIDAEAANTVVMRDGKIARFEMFWDRSAALEAAGLRPR